LIDQVKTIGGEHLQIGADGVVDPQASSFVEVDVAQVKECVQWLGRAESTTEATVSSFWLKHIVQQSAGTFVSNGALIVAAHRMGFPIDRDLDEESANVKIGVAKHCVDEFECGCGHP
jgi:hypothetical protein